MRPKRRFLDVVKEDMKEVGVKEMDIEDRKMSKDIQQLHYESVKRILLHDKALFRPCGAHQVQAKYELQYQYVKQHGTTVSSQEAGKTIPALLWSSSSSHSRVVLVRI